MRADTTDSLNVVTGSSAFTDTGTLGWNANGSLHSFGWVDGNNSALNQSCTYSSDPLNRIAAVNCGSPWGQTFAYDAFGNVTKTGNGGTSYSATYNAQTNQVASGVTATYDANGNQMQTNFVSPMSYDANHNPVMAGSTSLTYDALGRLVEFGGKPVVYGPSGEKLAVFNGTAYTASIALPGGGEAYYTSGALTSLRRKDWLGSSRLATSWAHAVVSKAAYAPYGENYGGAGTTDLDFTGQTQSSVSTLFDFPARKYDSNAGRWTVPDPRAWSVADPTNPQSLNRYAYVINSPMNLTDPLGLNYLLCPTSGPPTQGPGSGMGFTPPGCIIVGDQQWAQALGGQPECSVGGGQLFCNGGQGGLSVTFIPNDGSASPSGTCSMSGCGGVAGAIFGPTSGVGGSGSGSGAPSKPGNPSNPYSKCVSQAYAAAAAQPAVKPGTQDIIDGLFGAFVGAATDGTSALLTRTLKGFGLGIVSQSFVHLAQQGAAFKATLDGCQAQVQGGVYIPMTPPIP